MRRFVVPLIIALLVAVTPVLVMGADNNQAVAEKIASSLAEKFPGYDISVAYAGGKVRLAGQVASADMLNRAVEYVRTIPGVEVTDVTSELHIAGQQVPNRGVLSVAQQNGFLPQPGPFPIQNNFGIPNGNARQAAAMQNMQRNIQNQNAPAYAQFGQPYGQQRMQPQMPQQQIPPQLQMQPYAVQQMQQQQLMQQQQQAQQFGQPMPGQYNQPNVPDYAWPSYAAYPNYAEVSYPKQYSAKAWPYIGPFYPYPQAPLGWRKAAIEWHDGWWWIDFDDGSANGPFSPLFRHPTRYTY
ncbi:MAG: BON domain-containing protein [Planctomycetaceae bacterium]|jgi:hypothetical protein|nr:BON domain-containing protein [Planctomycetaceae bacterium]